MKNRSNGKISESEIWDLSKMKIRSLFFMNLCKLFILDLVKNYMNLWILWYKSSLIYLCFYYRKIYFYLSTGRHFRISHYSRLLTCWQRALNPDFLRRKVKPWYWTMDLYMWNFFVVTGGLKRIICESFFRRKEVS